MKKILNHFSIIALAMLLMSASEQNNFCEIFGNVYTTTSKSQAHYKVYIEDSEAFADILIFKEDNELFADEPGKWFFVKDQTFAEYQIYFTTNKREADFSIFYTESESFAGCN